ncbi:MAG TPA: PRC-barrel domain-containing protein [Candidatus Saccharimonadales bacterium]|nr:PRC-barrel domain-containing protein [Candidatus Saccharimonadales bacterium]
MLQLSTMLINRPVLSLRTGTQVATVLGPIINPGNLKIEGFYCQDSRSKQQLILVSQDVRDIMSRGFIINDHDQLVQPSELVRLTPVLQLSFALVGKPVFTSSGTKLGKVGDYSVDTDGMFVQKLYVTQSIFKSLSGGNLGIDRSQIVEITDKKIVVSDLTQKVNARARAGALA